MDYCDDCGEAAAFRCPIDGSYACSTHKRRYPSQFHRYIEQTETAGHAATATATAPITIRQSDGTTRTMKFEFDVCDTCFQAAQQQLPKRGGAAMKRRFGGSQRQAFIGIVTELVIPRPTNYIDLQLAALANATIAEMGSRPSWLKRDLIHSAAALFAETAKHLSRPPRHIDSAGSGRGWNFTIGYTDSEGRPSNVGVWIREDGAIRSNTPEPGWFEQTEEQSDLVLYVPPHSDVLKTLMTAVQTEPAPADIDMSFDDYLIRALGHRVHEHLSPAMKNRLRTEPKLRRIVDGYFNTNRGQGIDKDDAFVNALVQTFTSRDPDSGRA